MITKGKPRGIPFQKGTDERRHLAGSKSKAALDFKAEFKRIFNEEVNVRKLVRTLLRKAEQGIPWALQEAFDRGMGKAVQFTDNKFEDGRLTTLRVLWAGDTIDEETGLVIRSKGYIGSGELIIDGRKPIEEERARVARIRAGLPPSEVSARPALGPGRGDPGPSLNARLALEAGAASRLLEAGKDAEAAKEEGQDYVEACREA